ncbi:MAG: hypothetical protein WAS36_03015 [Candidatus Saccharimonadales bacterium]
MTTTDVGARDERTVRTGYLGHMYGGCSTGTLRGVDDQTWIQDVTGAGLYIDYDGLPNRDMGSQLDALAAAQVADALAMDKRLQSLGSGSRRP